LIDYQPPCTRASNRTTGYPFNNIQILAKAAAVQDSDGAHDGRQGFVLGPFMPEVTELFPNHAIIDRTSMNSWLDAGSARLSPRPVARSLRHRRPLTEACVTFPTLDMLKEGYEIYIPADACGDLSMEAHNRAMDRAVQAGAVPITSGQYLFELQQDWARSETYEGVMDILRAHSPYGIQVRFSKWALGEHASEGGARAAE
jgi:hypothetical protein